MMTKLACTVTNCVHNCDARCCKQAIIVDGKEACDSCDTCCGSFDEKREGSFKNIFKTPENRLEIACEAVKCVYNEDHKCKADNIDISGDGASRAEQTQCATFKMR